MTVLAMALEKGLVMDRDLVLEKVQEMVLETDQEMVLARVLEKDLVMGRGWVPEKVQG